MGDVDTYMGVLRQNVVACAANDDEDDHNERDERIFCFL